jgi:hypothetical protein
MASSVIDALLQKPAFVTTDLRAISHVLMHHDVYHKPDIIRHELIRLMGEGVLVTEGDQHRNQRRLLNPAFGPGKSYNLVRHRYPDASHIRRSSEGSHRHILGQGQRGQCAST